MRLKNLTIQAKLLLSFGILAFITLLVSVLALRALAQTSDSFRNYLHGINARAEMASLVRSAVDRRAIAARNVVLATDPSDVDSEKAQALRAHNDVQQRLKALNDMIETAARTGDSSETARKLVLDMERIESQYGPVASRILILAAAKQHDQAIQKINAECRPLLAELVKATDAYADYTRRRQHAIIADIESAYAEQRNLLISISIAAVILAVVSGLFITRSITRPIQSAVQFARRVAQGDLTSRIVANTRDETGQLMEALANMNTELCSIVSRVRDSCGNVAGASTQIAMGNADLSQRTENQAASLEETAATIEQINATVKQSSDNIRQANELACEAAGIAETGSAVVGRVVETMQRIHGSAAKINEITGLIEGIAFQTNILALNAAVEAARAGEQGRGFAVVASEVRSLALRSSVAAKEIKDLLSRSLEQVQAGTTHATEAGIAMAALTQAVTRVTATVSEIASASTEQTRGMEQVNQAIGQIDQITQQNASLVEQVAAASKSLQEQGVQLLGAVRFFRLIEATGPSLGCRVA